jgi:hypothetical protein
MNLGTVDPRAWNIAAGMCLVSGCGLRTIAVDGSETSANEGTESNTIGTEAPQPECVTDDDCPSHYYCRNGECSSSGWQDGYTDPDPYAECFGDSDCDVLEICVSESCFAMLVPSACARPDPTPGLAIPVASLALSFADVDADGAQELVVATASDLQVYESGLDLPSTSPRGLDSDSIVAMVGGPFDATPGDDVVILFADELRLHASDGAGNFAAPSVSASAWPDSLGLLGGQFDGVDSADLLIWASTGAGVVLGDGQTFSLSFEAIAAATARSVGEPLPGYALLQGQYPTFYGSDGVEIATGFVRGGGPYTLTSVAQLGDSFDLSSTVIGNSPWTLITQHDPAVGNLVRHWGLLGEVTAMAGGDFDGDERADIALIVDGALQIQADVLDDASCLASHPSASIAVGLAIGDHDGDGDDEIAVRFQTGNVEILDHE